MVLVDFDVKVTYYVFVNAKILQFNNSFTEP